MRSLRLVRIAAVLTLVLAVGGLVGVRAGGASAREIVRSGQSGTTVRNSLPRGRKTHHRKSHPVTVEHRPAGCPQLDTLELNEDVG